MSDRMEFEIVCPNDHNQTVTFSQEAFEEELKSGALVHHCNTCDTDWPPSSEEIARIRKLFSKNSSSARGRRIVVLPLIGTVSVIASGGLVVLALALTHTRPPDKVPLSVAGHRRPGTWSGQLRLMTWNLGYAGMGEEASFFLDGGRDVLAKDRSTVLHHLGKICAVLHQYPQDVYLLQEVDSGSRRSYNVNEVEWITRGFGESCYAYALNFDVLFLPYPLTRPMGRVRSGLLSLAARQPGEAVRLQLPGSFTWPTSAFNLDRCLLLLSLPREDGKTWVVINVHLEAWDAQGGLKRQELAFLKSLALEKYNEGNYVIVGGDWNSVLPGVRIDQFPSRDKPSQYYQPLPDDFTPGGWTWGVVATRPGNRQGNSRYQPGITYVSVIDGFLVSPNVKIQSVSTLPLDFKDSDHEPVMLQIAGR